MGIDEWPIESRPREKLLRMGPQFLSPEEFLAILLRFGCKGESAVDQGRRLLKLFGGVSGLYYSSDEEILNVKGIGPAKLTAIRASVGLTKVFLKEEAKASPRMIEPDEVMNLIQCSIRDFSREEFWALLLDSEGKMIEIIDLPQGLSSAGSVCTRKIAEEIIHHRATKMVMVHSHPSGNPSPSAEQDDPATRKIIQLCVMLGVEFIDHVIVGKSSYFSFRRSGKLRTLEDRTQNQEKKFTQKRKRYTK